MQIRRSIVFSMMGDKTTIKAVVLLMLLKTRLGKTSAIPDFSINKIAKISGVSYSTIKNYLHIWERMGLVEYQGASGNVFVVKKLSSSTKHRNYDVDRLDFRSFKRLYNSFKSFIFLVIQSRKDYIRRILRIAISPKRGENYKMAKKDCKNYVRMCHGDKSFEYHEFGLSYKGIAKKMGFCAKTAQKIVFDTIKRKWCKKQTHFNSVYLPNVCRMPVDGYTFTTNNYGFIVSANTYEMSRAWSMVFNRR